MKMSDYNSMLLFEIKTPEMIALKRYVDNQHIYSLLLRDKKSDYMYFNNCIVCQHNQGYINPHCTTEKQTTFMFCIEENPGYSLTNKKNDFYSFFTSSFTPANSSNEFGRLYATLISLGVISYADLIFQTRPDTQNSKKDLIFVFKTTHFQRLSPQELTPIVSLAERYIKTIIDCYYNGDKNQHLLLSKVIAKDIYSRIENTGIIKNALQEKDWIKVRRHT